MLLFVDVVGDFVMIGEGVEKWGTK